MIIGEAEKASGISAKMIRYYESIGLIDAADRTASGYRVYSDRDVQNLRFIRQCRDLGLSLERIKLLLNLWRNDQRASSEVKQIALAHVAELETKIADMRSMADTLQKLADRCHGDNDPDCAIINALSLQNQMTLNKKTGSSKSSAKKQHPH
ncbi:MULTISPECIES: Cu(I)-responsive transcriptional regulator [Pseudochrobactrum]|uniref:Cu(I)-responsive transcriptional regulator n=1 Tax=Pseudochrobactrum saccharolyticum TaxID=354352 RepID=A0A7W8ENR0_9HYPH|nr:MULTISPECIES: Cu(I)-responsive transcriptional regulator [Pseudochrobactrum]KAB0540577.1 Cu(I)-responsive transcriptional regulator [Pseudochrobactrum saccharolyticum]MBB5090136.1 Cu(I)-responsive transcriptional regulator [Pseudochrobactrum saccharolyticum]MDP8252040.1 Cu(I)-responsive transcriptional regulator [Pseudochrobactrum saccharolyticum]